MIHDKKYSGPTELKQALTALQLSPAIQSFVVAEVDRFAANIEKQDAKRAADGKSFFDQYDLRLMVSTDDFQTLVHIHPTHKDTQA